MSEPNPYGSEAAKLNRQAEWKNSMGSTSILTIGTDLEEQFAPFQATDEKLGSAGLYYFFWEVGPRRYETWTDWRDAFKLRQGHCADARFVAEDQPPNVAYSAQKQAIDFEGMMQETAIHAGQIWDCAQQIGIPQEFILYADRRETPPVEDFNQQLEIFMENTYPESDAYKWAYLYFVDRKRLIYPRQRYVDLCMKARIAEPYILAHGKLISASSLPHIQQEQSPLRQWDMWLDFSFEFVDQLPYDSLITKVFLKQ